jgi:hypothetical protein
MSQTPTTLLSEEARDVAEALLAVRSRFVALIGSIDLPPDIFADISTVAVYGLAVAEALNRLGRPDPVPGSSYLADRR